MQRDFSLSSPKINPSRRCQSQPRPDGTPDDNDRVEIGPTKKAFAEWAKLGLTAPNLERMRQRRLRRVVTELQKRELAGALLYDPLNIRYATDATNMQLWTAHNFSRAAFVTASGHVILWEQHRTSHLAAFLPLISEIRPGGAGFFYFETGDQTEEKARRFASEILDILNEHCGRNRRLAIDKIEIEGGAALRELGLEIHSGQEVMEHARVVKGKDEIRAMRCALATCEIAVAEMRKALRPGLAEAELWSILHAENISRGGEWIETRILNSGPRTNPWMQEAGPRQLQNGDLLAFDTDLIGPYGMCADISRTWYCGDQKPTAEQCDLHAVAHEHIMANLELLRPGVSFTEITQRGHRLPEKFIPQRYGVMLHGVGLCDEFPAIYYPQDFIEGAFNYVLEPGMTLCVEAYVGAIGGRDGVKLEDQILITDTGHENLTNCPFDQKLMGQ